MVRIRLWQEARLNEPLGGIVHPVPVHSGSPYRSPRRFQIDVEDAIGVMHQMEQLTPVVENEL